MDRLTLVAGLKKDLDTIARLGGDPDLHAEIAYDLLQEPRSQVFRCFHDQQVQFEAGRRVPCGFETLAEPPYFVRAPRFAFVHIRQYGVLGEDHARLLKDTVNLLARSLLRRKSRVFRLVHIPEDQPVSIHDLLRRRLTQFWTGVLSGVDFPLRPS